MELDAVKASSQEDKTVFKAGQILRKEITSMEDTIPWPPQYRDLTVDKIYFGNHLSKFLNVLFSGKIIDVESMKMSRLRASIGQDIVYNVTNGKVRTPKSILFPYNIKMLTNNTELINMTNKLGHGISYTLLEELETENAYKIISQQDDGIVVPTGCINGAFTVLVADNIDRQEETLSGKSIIAINILQFT